MKYSFLICSACKPGLLSYLTGDLAYRGIFPEIFFSEKFGLGTVRVRLEIDCDEDQAVPLVAYWQEVLHVQSVIVTPPVSGVTVIAGEFAPPRSG